MKFFERHPIMSQYSKFFGDDDRPFARSQANELGAAVTAINGAGDLVFAAASATNPITFPLSFFLFGAGVSKLATAAVAGSAVGISRMAD